MTLQTKTVSRHTGLLHAEEADAAEIIGLAADVKILEGGGEVVRESIATACCSDIQVMLSAFPYFAGLYNGAVEIIIGVVHLTYLEYVI